MISQSKISVLRPPVGSSSGAGGITLPAEAGGTAEGNRIGVGVLVEGPDDSSCCILKASYAGHQIKQKINI